ncbi:MAG: DUF924 domain-containing protein [Geminicoccaceae bacterium]|nr:DUF924 domain-containing protein [Geminicoccaceae bacterium]MCX8100357.1 DUF924 domain-containing protein [Geminicoccaceae bacterium]MDW8368848.1 DUF924 family protein [Geminicoccaceae bacterium]
MAPLAPEARALLDFWLAPGREQSWFRPDPAFDRLLAERFGDLVDRAAAGAFEEWLEHPEGALALVLLVDQLPRNVHRGTPRAFAYDAKAREVARAALARGHHLAVPARARLFFYLPLEHSEDLADQDRAVELCRPLGGEAFEYAVRHRAVIRRFGRFPHRNTILGRPNTAEEEAFLLEPGSSF